MKLIYCNQCGALLSSGLEEITEKDWFTGEKVWGYFSEKDRKIHRFSLCETCYDRFVAGFQIPVFQEEQKEF